MASRRIVVLGDSLAVSPTPSASFPAELQARLAKAYPGWTIVNASFRGDTTSGGVRRFGCRNVQGTGQSTVCRPVSFHVPDGGF
jgi:hypothetical protein